MLFDPPTAPALQLFNTWMRSRCFWNRRGRVSNPGPNERQSYRYQNLLTPAEHDRWTSLANAGPQISEKRLNELELRTPAAPTSGRRSRSGVPLGGNCSTSGASTTSEASFVNKGRPPPKLPS